MLANSEKSSFWEGEEQKIMTPYWNSAELFQYNPLSPNPEIQDEEERERDEEDSGSEAEAY